MSKIIGIDLLKLEHGGRYDLGFWTTGHIVLVKEDRFQRVELTVDDAEDLEYVLLKWVKKKKKFGSVSL